MMTDLSAALAVYAAAPTEANRLALLNEQARTRRSVARRLAR